MFLRALSRIAIVAIFAAPFVATGQSLPLEPTPFTSYVAERLRALALEHAQVRVDITALRPLAIKLTAPSGMSVDTNLSDLYAHCAALQGRCGDAAEQLAQAAFRAFGEATRPIGREMLRAMVLPAAQVHGIEEIRKQRGTAAFVAKPFVGDLWIAVIEDRKPLFAIATTDTLKQLELDESAAFALALKNTRDSKAPVLERAMPLRGTYFAVLSEDDYESSRVLMHEDWAEVAKNRRGDLLVSVPASNTLIFGSARSAVQIKELRDLAVQELQKAQRPLTAQIFRWRAEGWEVVKNPGEERAQTPPDGALTGNVRPTTTSAQ
jgi:hypothetical protein